MKTVQKLALGLGLSILSGLTGAVLPTGEYSCQVETLNKKGGLVMVQADTRKQAERSAVGKAARTVSGAKSLATEVVECIAHDEARFQDPEFRRFAENVPR